MVSCSVIVRFLFPQIYKNYRLQTPVCNIILEKRTIPVKNRTNPVKNRTNPVIFGFAIPYKRARVIELWNIEMLHQGHERRLKKAVFRVFDSGKIFKKTDQTNPKGATKKQQRKNQPKKTEREKRVPSSRSLFGFVYDPLYKATRCAR